MALTDTAIRNSKSRDKPYKLSDGAGLYLLINPTGSKLWRLKYKFAAKEKLLSIGAYPVITLASAREKALEAKKMLADNIDPSQVKKEEKLKALVESENSFKVIARSWHTNHIQK